MGKVIVDLSMSLDGYIAGPNDGRGNPLGDGGDALFEWMRVNPDAYGTKDFINPPEASRPVVDEINVNLAPVLLGGGVGLFDPRETGPVELKQTRVVESGGVTHLRYRVVR